MNNNEDNKIVYLRIDDIMPNRFQPREVFDETGLEELADSIKEHGVIQPIIVRQVGNKYELIAGERRTKASALAGLTTIPAIIKNMDDRESAKVSLLENLQRKNLTPIEEARTYKRILELDNMTQEDLAKTMGKSQPMVANKLRLLALPEEVQDALLKNQISERHARSLLNVKDKQTQLRLLERIKNERLTVRELDNEIKNLNTGSYEEPSTSIPTMSNSNQADYATNTTGGFNNNPMGSTNFSNNFSNAYEVPQTTSNFANTYEEPKTTSNFSNSFNNMGLNDYKSSIGGFNNMPNNFNNMSYDNALEQSNFNNFDSFNNGTSNDTNNILSNSDNQDNNFNNNFNQPTQASVYEQFNEPKKPEINASIGLGSMFDGNQNYVLNQNTPPAQTVSKDFFVSNIKDNTTKVSENKFLPNFDNQNTDNFSNNSYNNSNDLNNFETINNNQFDNKNESSTFTDFNSMNMPINNYTNQSNQGDLFNQPLNIVNVPNSSYEEKSDMTEDNYQENNQAFDNPFDDAYQNILFAKPVPINPQSSSNEPIATGNIDNNNSNSIDNNDNNNTENSNENTNESSNNYVSIDHQRTLFSTRDAVLELKKTTDRIKEDGINLDSEEIDFDDYYQIIIKIKK